MATEVIMPALGMAQETGTLVAWLRAEGDSVTAGEPLMEVETDKAVVEVEAPASGVLSGVLVQPGDKVPVGQVIAYLRAPGEAQDAVARPGPQAAAPVLASAPQAAAAAPGGSAAPAAAPEPKGAASAAAAPGAPAVRAVQPAPGPAGAPRPAASPKARRLAREQGLALEGIAGSGPAGAVLAADVQGAAAALPAPPVSAPPRAGAPAQAVALPDFASWGEVRREPLTTVRRLTAERMHLSWSTIPQVTTFDKADITELERWRKQFGPRVEKAGARLTPTAVIVKVVAAALRRFPLFASSYDTVQQEIVYKDYVHIGVAVDTERGLLVPVLRDVDRKNVVQLAVELGQSAEKARARKLTPQDMQGGCFTVSNLGGIGGVGFTPIINPPEVAILGVARAGTEPVWMDGRFEPRQLLPLSLTYDHRLIDGADGARFLRWLCQALESPWLTLAEG